MPTLLTRSLSCNVSSPIFKAGSSVSASRQPGAVSWGTGSAWLWRRAQVIGLPRPCHKGDMCRRDCVMSGVTHLVTSHTPNLTMDDRDQTPSPELRCSEHSMSGHCYYVGWARGL